MELTIEVNPSTIEIIKAYASEKGDPTALISATASKAIELALSDKNIIGFALRTSTVQLLNGYAHIVGASPDDAAIEVSETLSSVLEDVLKDKIAGALGLSPQPAVVKVGRRHRAPPPTHQDTTGISDGLGDDDLDPEMPPAETAPEALVPSGGLSDKDLEGDMSVKDPNVEAKADASSFGDLLIQGNGEAEDLFATEVGYVDARIAKRKKGPTKSRGKVKSMTESVENEGAAI